MRRVGDEAGLMPGGSLFVEAYVRGALRSCVIVRNGSGFHGFLNVCAHRNQPVVVDGRPFDESGLLECRAHGARYEPSTGLCVAGPCEGARLVRLQVVVRDGGLFVEDDDAIDDSIYGDDG